MNDEINKTKAKVILLLILKLLYLNASINIVNTQITPIATMYSPIL